MRDIELALQEHKQAVIDAGYHPARILGIFLYGSQNYNLATENSDVDTKAIIIPSIFELCDSKCKPFVKELSLPNNEKCVVMDIRHYVENLYKQNINYVEILFTKYKWINPTYAAKWELLIKNREAIARYDENKAIQSMGHQALHTLRQDPFNPSKFTRTLFLEKFLRDYISNDKPYEEILRVSDEEKQPYLDIKTGKTPYDLEDIFKLRYSIQDIVNNVKFDDANEEKQKNIRGELTFWTAEFVLSLL